MKKILSSDLLHLKNETQLFDFIIQAIEENSSNMILLKFSFGGYVLKNSIDKFIDIIESSDMSPSHFTFLSNCFEYSYLVHDETATQKILSFCSFFHEFHQIEKENLMTQLTFDSLPRIVKFSLDPQIKHGMDLLKASPFDEHTQKLVFDLLYELAKEGDPGACWRVAACYFSRTELKKIFINAGFLPNMQ